MGLIVAFYPILNYERNKNSSDLPLMYPQFFNDVTDMKNLYGTMDWDLWDSRGARFSNDKHIVNYDIICAMVKLHGLVSHRRGWSSNH